MSLMLPEGGEVMRRAACGDVSPAPPPAPAPSPPAARSENKELLRQQLLSSKERDHKQKTRTRQKNRWKLKFHHQALPQEYLDHYERSLQRAPAPAPAPRPRDTPPPAPAPAPAPDALRLWAQRLAALRPAPPSPPSPPRRSPPPPPKVLSYEDLPYMGEMTLNNSKPRRGRKPKKADICHLIYENYGTVVGGAPGGARARSDLQSRIISNLLERRRAAPPSPAPAPPSPAPAPDQPLNLCVRDLRRLRLRAAASPPAAPAAPPSPSPSPPSSSSPVPSPEQPNAISVIQRASPALQQQLLYYGRLAAPGDEGGARLVLKRLSELLDPALAPPPPTPAPPPPTPAPPPPPPPPRSPPAPRPAKRKRSALFIPAVAARGAGAAPRAEVSICKFKFTGGSKPSLQEKKMLSVDAGGNFRYYSGAGAAGGKRPAAPAKGYEYLTRAPAPAPPAARRKSRKSVQRERLEQTFKEKGFLIQTQQLQSAEGATYCKFRQLRKFTRYLFRSWKDYLPGAEPAGAEPGAAPAGAEPAPADPAWDADPAQ